METKKAISVSQEEFSINNTTPLNCKQQHQHQHESKSSNELDILLGCENFIYSPLSNPNAYRDLAGLVIVIEGIICSGKSTLLENICTYLKARDIPSNFYLEEPNRDFLALYYQDPKKYAFSFQMEMLNARQRIHDKCRIESTVTFSKVINEIGQRFKSDRPISWIDRSMLGDFTFAALVKQNGNITDDEYKIYINKYKSLGPYVYDYIVFLDVSAERAHYLNINMRGNKEEEGIPLVYFQNLRKMYYIVFSTMITRNTVTNRGKKMRLVMINNNEFSNLEQKLEELIFHAPSVEQVTDIFNNAPKITNNSSNQDVSDAYAYVHAQYAKLYIEHEQWMETINGHHHPYLKTTAIDGNVIRYTLRGK